jgi:hypothetical protein
MLTEHQEQCLFVEWFEIKFPTIKFFAIPNGIRSSIGAAVKTKKEGLRTGVPDIYVPAWKLWIEFKREKGGVLSPAQKEWRDYLIGIGDNYILAHGFNDARVKLIEHLDSL